MQCDTCSVINFRVIYLYLQLINTKAYEVGKTVNNLKNICIPLEYTHIHSFISKCISQHCIILLVSPLLYVCMKASDNASPADRILLHNSVSSVFTETCRPNRTKMIPYLRVF
jgi:hypothetical protein